MNTLLESHSYKTETGHLCRDDVWFVRDANGHSAKRGRSALRWLKATVPTIDSRRDDLARTHCRKIWRSMMEDGAGTAAIGFKKYLMG